jgi:hypothetical protein
MTLEEVKELLDNLVSKGTTKEEILKTLDSLKPKCYYKIEYGYFNCKVKVRNDSRFVRIYENKKNDFRVQMWSPCEMTYSGISTFPSAHRR